MLYVLLALSANEGLQFIEFFQCGFWRQIVWTEARKRRLNGGRGRKCRTGSGPGCCKKRQIIKDATLIFRTPVAFFEKLEKLPVDEGASR